MCRHFACKSNLFVSGSDDWKNLYQNNCKRHFESKYHKFSHEKFVLHQQSKQTGSIVTQVNSQHSVNVMRNREVLSAHIEVILLCAHQDIALRGHRESNDEKNCGNFLAILNLVKKKCPEYKNALDALPKNAKYSHYTIQNEIINICGSFVTEMVVEEVKSNGDYYPYSVIADESRDNGGTEQLCVSVRYVYENSIKERFLGFTDLHKFDADTISSAIVRVLQEAGLSIKYCVSQAYDGAPVMSGDITGVHTLFEIKVGGKCPYIHCYAHRLNLVLVFCCEVISEVREMLGLLQAIYNFQCNSAKRAECFENAQKTAGYSSVFVAEMNRRLTANDDIIFGVEASDPKSDKFLDQDYVIKFCTDFSRFDFDLEGLKGQITVARNLLIERKFEKILDCYNFLRTMASGFKDLIRFYQLVLSIPVATATGERSFSSMNRIKSNPRTTMDDERLSNLTTLSINRDLSTLLYNDTSPVIDRFALVGQRKIELLL